jgi:hypothetical protein
VRLFCFYFIDWVYNTYFQVAVKESENEMLRTQLDGLKKMIVRNSVAAKCPVFIDLNE